VRTIYYALLVLGALVMGAGWWLVLEHDAGVIGGFGVALGWVTCLVAVKWWRPDTTVPF